ncbi:hypothetical protein L596_010423 [Steinernema carpocapsae]|uniref:Uncharacterized protein n=1 Tax=Steinernema carpocapsae TaxID=34508 RepID=A0A4V6A6W5_STECR|nr:hypothetical protein L596_010423 [Steinernema carpocapsae]
MLYSSFLSQYQRITIILSNKRDLGEDLGELEDVLACTEAWSALKTVASVLVLAVTPFATHTSGDFPHVLESKAFVRAETFTPLGAGVACAHKASTLPVRTAGQSLKAAQALALPSANAKALPAATINIGIAFPDRTLF